MSEYTPITGELRDWFEHAYNYGTGEDMFKKVPAPWFGWKSTIEQMLDAIDSIHANLERENQSLKAELDRVLGEDEHDGWVRLPVDADGVPIRVGDTVEYVDDTLEPRNVTSINLAGDGWWVYINGIGRRPDKYRHVTPDTWERIIEDVLDGSCSGIDAVARCKALCERTKEDA